MSTTVIEQATEAPAFDPKKFMEDRNSGKEPAKIETQVEKPKETVKADAEPESHARPSRSAARLNRALGREQALRETLQAELEALKAGKTAAAPAEDAEPQRSAFTSDAEYLRATQKWDKAQEAKTSSKSTQESEQQKKFTDHVQAMRAKSQEDAKKLPDFQAVADAAADDEDQPEIDWGADKHSTLVGLIANSDMQAYLFYHLAKNPAVAEKLYGLSEEPASQIRFFHRLEGQLEKMYDSVQKPAQGSEAEKPKEDRKHLAEAEPVKAKPGETAAGAIPAKPKPSSEVAARGGSPAPDGPLPGSPAWMAMRNQTQFGR